MGPATVELCLRNTLSVTQFSTNDLAVRTLRDLNIISAEELPSAADLQFALETIQSEFGRMEADGIVMWGTTLDSINHVYFTVLSNRMGAAIGPAFGVMSAASALGVKEAAENVIRRLAAPVKTPELMTIERAARGTRIRDPIISQP
jgi:hypothetical protein